MFELTKRYAVYVDYTTEEVPRPFYVGKGNKARVNHIPRNDLHGCIALKHGHQRKVVMETDDEGLALQEEKRLVAEHKTYAHGGPRLVGSEPDVGR